MRHGRFGSLKYLYLPFILFFGLLFEKLVVLLDFPNLAFMDLDLDQDPFGYFLESGSA